LDASSEARKQILVANCSGIAKAGIQAKNGLRTSPANALLKGASMLVLFEFCF
jgi:hypothetical protein